MRIWIEKMEGLPNVYFDAESVEERELLVRLFGSCPRTIYNVPDVETYKAEAIFNAGTLSGSESSRTIRINPNVIL